MVRDGRQSHAIQGRWPWSRLDLSLLLIVGLAADLVSVMVGGVVLDRLVSVGRDLATAAKEDCNGD